VFLDREGLDEHERAEKREQAAEQRREVRRPHAHSGAHLVMRPRPHYKEQAETDKHEAGPKVLRTLDFHVSSTPREQRSLARESVTRTFQAALRSSQAARVPVFSATPRAGAPLRGARGPRDDRR